jgi:hypothetical protein
MGMGEKMWERRMNMRMRIRKKDFSLIVQRAQREEKTSERE